MPFGACDSCRKYYAVTRDGAEQGALVRNLCPGCGVALRSCTAGEALSVLQGQAGGSGPEDAGTAGPDRATGSKGGEVSCSDWEPCPRGQHPRPPGLACPFCLQRTWNRSEILRRRFQEARRVGQVARCGADRPARDEEPDRFDPTPSAARQPLVPPLRHAPAPGAAEAPAVGLPSLMTRYQVRQAETACAHARELVSDAEEVVLRSQSLVRRSQELRRGSVLARAAAFREDRRRSLV